MSRKKQYTKAEKWTMVYLKKNNKYRLSDPPKHSEEEAEIQDDFFQIIPKPKESDCRSNWRSIDLHFEIAWWPEEKEKNKVKIDIDTVDKVEILVHLETTKQKTIDFFRKRGAEVTPRKVKGHPDYYRIGEPFPLNVNFTSEKEAIKSLENIIAVLERVFSDVLDLADEYLKENPEG